MKRFRIVHRSRYRFDPPVSGCRCQLRLTARTFPYQEVAFSQVVAQPLESRKQTRQDTFGNTVVDLHIEHPHQVLELSAHNVVTTQRRLDPTTHGSRPWEDVAASTATGYPDFTAPSTLVTPGPIFADYARSSFTARRPLILALQDLIARIHSDFFYAPNSTNVSTTAEAALRQRMGVCQDFAHVAIACLRSLGLPARYVSGYVERAPASDGLRRIGNIDSHAWLALNVPGLGWLDVDPTNNCWVDDHYVTLAVGRDYQDVSPVTGEVFGDARHRLDVFIDVERCETSLAITA